MRTRTLALALASGFALLPACGGPPARAPSASSVPLPGAFADAFQADAIGAPADAIRAHLAVVGAAARAAGDPWQLDALEASLDALVTRSMPSLGDAARDGALAGRFAPLAGAPSIAGELAKLEGQAEGPFAKGLIARALTALAQRRGDAADAEKERVASGCAREAVVIGPTSWTSITGPAAPGPLDAADAPIQASYATGDSFGTQAHPVVAHGQGCVIELSQEKWRPGVREVVVDVTVPRAQTIGVVLRAHGAATLHVGGAVVARRAFELGDGEAAQPALVAVTAGTVRLVARVGTAKDDDSVELDVFGADGAPLRAVAPAVGSAANGRALGTTPVATPPAGVDNEMLLAATAKLATGDTPGAERLLSRAATQASAPPALALAYARAIESARDLSPATRAERGRSAYERVLEAWPASWEAAVAHAVLAGVRRGREEAGIETLRDLDGLRAKSQAPAPVLDAFEAMTCGREHLYDRARTAMDRARPALAGTALLADAEDSASPRVGAELVAAACDPASPTARDTLECFDAARQTGDRAREASELARIRSLLGAPERFLSVELREALAAGDDAVATRAFAAMPPADQSLAELALLDGSPDLEAKLLRMALSARDAPAALAPLLRVRGAGEDQEIAEMDATAERLAAQDRAQPLVPNAATAILAHTESYDVSPGGIVRWRLFDVRRVSGTTDVEQNAQAAAPAVWGRGAMRAIRRRILKKDGRILEPDRTPRASQDHADLSQLEQGDAVEAVYEGYSLAGDTGDIGIDTPDLLPDRTAVHTASIELRLPRSLKGSLWTHRLLGAATERADGDVRVLSWKLQDQPVRRVEDGVPKMDRNVALSFTTTQWSGVAQAVRETLASLDEHDPEVAAWARDAAGGAKTPREIVNAVVVAAGKALREADPGTLSDYGGGIAPMQAQTARTFLTSHDGSRSWLILRSLRELGVPADVAIAENDPYSADPAFPPHYGRFVHPLVVAHLPPEKADAGQAQGPGEDVWIDADVQGPPLPAGRVSPELRGRLAMRADGTIAPLPSIGAAADERDEVDVRLALDAQGNARGTFAVVLRGREAQDLSEALLRIVGAERQRALREVVLAWLPWANVDAVQLASTEGSWQVSLRADVSVSGYAQLDAGKIWLLPGMDTLHRAWPRARVSSLAETLASRAGRESALAVASAVQYHVHRRIDLPAGATVARMPGPVDVRAKLVDASRRLSVTTGGTSAPSASSGASGAAASPTGAIEDDFVLDVATGTVPATEYDAFVEAAHAADDGFLASTRVTMP